MVVAGGSGLRQTDTTLMSDSVLVRDLMTARVVTIGMDDSLADARHRFARYGFHHLIVTERGRAVGVLSDRDVLRHLSPFIDTPLVQRSQDLATLQRRIHQIMTRRLIAIDPDSTAAQAAHLMVEQKVSCLPVIDERERVVGIITLRDLARWLVAQCERAASAESL